MGRGTSAAHTRFWGLLIALLAAGCSVPFVDSGQPTADPAPAGPGVDDPSGVPIGTADPGEPPPGLAVAARRALTVLTTACGDASAAEGSAVAVADRRVLVAAHVVAGATEIRIGRRPVQQSGQEADQDHDPETWPTATIVAFDSMRDLALLEVDLDRWTVPREPVRSRVLSDGEAGVIVGATTSGDVDYTITEKTIIEMDEVRGTGRSRRSGYLLDAATVPGDSGSGLYDLDGYLAGVLFAVSSNDGRRSWATAADEVEAFLADDSVVGSFACNPARSRLERQAVSG